MQTNQVPISWHGYEFPLFKLKSMSVSQARANLIFAIFALLVLFGWRLMMIRTTATRITVLIKITNVAGAAKAQIELSCGESQHLKPQNKLWFVIFLLGIQQRLVRIANQQRCINWNDFNLDVLEPTQFEQKWYKD